ncbi:hypothetical protein K461DRAFT_173289 [Myriangium duriaei CBS 260.36]|uniref:Zn(2)-C6 fungal-type domain-containing protein n=1 Tax=Myriangium duriaei CBS 260.36 TaxID=1168546 RepID=A0A9P4J2Z9_9PEZI|nr:hypothetical protein K461DRAFT_173289 [Myriangium duriaei CBS 260.36]
MNLEGHIVNQNEIALSDCRFNYTVTAIPSGMAGQKRPSPTASDETGASETHSKRQRQVRSCLPCRDRKVACDKCLPCASCVRYRNPQNCVYLGDLPAGQATSQIAANGDHHQSNGHTTQTTPQSMADRSITAHSSTPFRSSLSGLPHLNHKNPFARGRLAAKPSSTVFYIGPTAWSVAAPIDIFHHDISIGNVIQPSWRRLLGLSAAFGGGPYNTFGGGPYDTVLDPDPHIAEQTLSLAVELPSEDQCRTSVAVFLNTVNQSYPVVDRPRFEATMQNFFSDRSTASPAWVGLLMAIVASGHALRLLSSSETTKSSLCPLSAHLASLVHKHALAYETTSYRPGLETFQTILVLVLHKKLRFGWMDGTNGTSGLLGLANRLAFTMGLHRDSREALNSIPAEDAKLRRKLFSIYIHLDFEHSLQSGMPFLLRPADFDADFEPRHIPGGCTHLCNFMQLFPLLSQALQLTNSSRSNASLSDTIEILSRLQHKSQSFIKVEEPTAMTQHDLLHNIRSSMTPIILFRVQVGLFALTLDKPEIRKQYNLQNLLTPPLCVLERFLSLLQQVDDIIPQDSVRLWKIFVISLFRHTLYNSVGYILHFLQRSLFDESLLACKGTLPAAMDSTRIFRKIRLTLEILRCTFDVSIQCIRENTTQMVYLRYVEERHRRFIEKGTEHFDVNSAEGKAVTDCLCDTIDDMLHVAEDALGLGHNGISPSQMPPGAGQFDPNVMDSMMNMPFAEAFALPEDSNWPWVGEDFQLDWMQPMGPQINGDLQQITRP